MTSCSSLVPRVYPRARGEAGGRFDPAFLKEGLSPRSRGSLVATALGGHTLGSIPALAGKPMSCTRASRSTRVYPRARGEAVETIGPRPIGPGLSPRSRGSLLHTQPRHGSQRSIPALAGKPSRTSPVSGGVRVYPRARGEATGRSAGARRGRGLSPRSRGSRLEYGDLYSIHGSIPALAGKPIRGSRPA